MLPRQSQTKIKTASTPVNDSQLSVEDKDLQHLTRVINEFFQTEQSYRDSMRTFTNSVLKNGEVDPAIFEFGNKNLNTEQQKEMESGYKDLSDKKKNEINVQIKAMMEPYIVLAVNPFEKVAEKFNAIENKMDKAAILGIIKEIHAIYEGPTYQTSVENTLIAAENQTKMTKYLGNLKGKKILSPGKIEKKKININFDFSNYSIQPAQRLPRETLLTQEMAKKMPQEAQEAKVAITAILEKNKKNADIMNERIFLADSRATIHDLASSQKFNKHAFEKTVNAIMDRSAVKYPKLTEKTLLEIAEDRIAKTIARYEKKIRSYQKPGKMLGGLGDMIVNKIKPKKFAERLDYMLYARELLKQIIAGNEDIATLQAYKDGIDPYHKIVSQELENVIRLVTEAQQGIPERVAEHERAVEKENERLKKETAFKDARKAPETLGASLEAIKNRKNTADRQQAELSAASEAARLVTPPNTLEESLNQLKQRNERAIEPRPFDPKRGAHKFTNAEMSQLNEMIAAQKAEVEASIREEALKMMDEESERMKKESERIMKREEETRKKAEIVEKSKKISDKLDWNEMDAETKKHREKHAASQSNVMPEQIERDQSGEDYAERAGEFLDLFEEDAKLIKGINEEKERIKAAVAAATAKAVAEVEEQAKSTKIKLDKNKTEKETQEERKEVKANPSTAVSTPTIDIQFRQYEAPKRDSKKFEKITAVAKNMAGKVKKVATNPVVKKVSGGVKKVSVSVVNFIKSPVTLFKSKFPEKGSFKQAIKDSIDRIGGKKGP